MRWARWVTPSLVLPFHPFEIIEYCMFFLRVANLVEDCRPIKKRFYYIIEIQFGQSPQVVAQISEQVMLMMCGCACSGYHKVECVVSHESKVPVLFSHKRATR